ncbi:porin [Cupriavidus taiwanensis]|uniref:porin n=1 Tax=Cupriavidus taiwanensis TaxID=164546 RepID=UPI002540CD44|nr:porin [Cupriavidus taiwanensis]MDK3025985.1 porin [Cupriavidus taiwanensis]
MKGGGRGKLALLCAGALGLGLGLGSAAQAQEGVTLYGLLSVGVAYVSNEGGNAATRMVPGTMQNNRWGLRGTEDLGGGARGLFVLESGFGLDDGRSQQGGRLFGRQAYVGLGHDQYGTVTFGRQYDAVFDTLGAMSAPVAAAGLATHVGDNDNVFGSFRHNNAVKYVSPSWGGLRAEATYALSDAGRSANNRSFSLGSSYASGPLKLAAAYMQLDHPGLVASGNPAGAVTDDYAGAPFVLFHSSPLTPTAGVARQRVGGLAAGYSVGAARVNAMVTSARYRYQDGTGMRLNNYDLNLGYRLTPALELGAAYVFTDGHYGGTDARPRWHMGQLSLDYALSRRTDVYVYGVYQRARAARADIYLFAPSSNGRQLVFVTGIRHKF